MVGDVGLYQMVVSGETSHQNAKYLSVSKKVAARTIPVILEWGASLTKFIHVLSNRCGTQFLDMLVKLADSWKFEHPNKPIQVAFDSNRDLTKEELTQVQFGQVDDYSARHARRSGASRGFQRASYAGTGEELIVPEDQLEYWSGRNRVESRIRKAATWNLWLSRENLQPSSLSKELSLPGATVTATLDFCKCSHVSTAPG